VGVFVAGETPEGLGDMVGNVWEWTSSLIGSGEDDEFAYPYRHDDGREDPEAGGEFARISRGGSWTSNQVAAQAACRDDDQPGFRSLDDGFRLAAPSQ
jgi:iron(II)-dependent oxidoreductase